MAITQTITDSYAFFTWLKNSDSYRNSFTIEGACALQEYLEQYSEDIQEDVDFDPVAWCVEFSEYESAWDAMEQYQPDDMPVEGADGDDLLEIQAKNEAKALEYLQDNTQVIELDNGGVIIQDF